MTTSSEKMRQKTQMLESTKRLINLALILGCVGLEIAIFSYHWYYHFRPSVVYPLNKAYFWGNVLPPDLQNVRRYQVRIS